MAHKFEGPKDRTNPLSYVPIALVSVIVVGWVFASGFLHGRIDGQKPAEEKAVHRAVEKPNIQAMAEPTTELVAKGKSLFGLYCASCHGPEGLGDGDKGVSLNPKPRNFHQATGWKNGASVAGMWKTLQEGIPGSSMASYQLTPEEERIAIIHFVRETWVPEPPAITPDDIAALPAGSSGDAGGEGGAPTGGGPEAKDIHVALASLRHDAAKPVAVSAPHDLADMPGAGAFAANCASCHGPGGGGADSVRVLTTAPYMRVSTPPFASYGRAKWLTDSDEFARVVVESEPGATVHGFATMTRGELSDLREYVAALAREGVAHR